MGFCDMKSTHVDKPVTCLGLVNASREACKGPLCSFGSRKAAAKQPSALEARKFAPSKGPPAACQAVVKQLDGKVDGLAGRLEEALARDPARFRWVVFIL